MNGERTIWDDFKDAMKRYYRDYFPDGEEFDPTDIGVFEESRMYADNDKIVLDIWFEYHSTDEVNTVYHVVINRMPYDNDVKIDRYSFDCRASFDISDSQE